MKELERFNKHIEDFRYAFELLFSNVDQMHQVDVLMDFLDELHTHLHAIENQIKNAKEVELHESLPKDHVCTCFM